MHAHTYAAALAVKCSAQPKPGTGSERPCIVLPPDDCTSESDAGRSHAGSGHTPQDDSSRGHPTASAPSGMTRRRQPLPRVDGLSKRVDKVEKQLKGQYTGTGSRKKTERAILLVLPAITPCRYSSMPPLQPSSAASRASEANIQLSHWDAIKRIGELEQDLKACRLAEHQATARCAG